MDNSKNTKQQIDIFYKDFIDSYKSKNENKDFNPTYQNLYTLGKIIEQKIPDVIDKREQYGKNKTITFKYVSWKWYEYILKKIDSNFWWELIDYSDNYQMVKIKIIWLNKEYSGWYAVENSAIKKETNEPLNNLGEMVINEGMRCFAKVCSRATGLFMHLWYEGGNN